MNRVKHKPAPSPARNASSIKCPYQKSWGTLRPPPGADVSAQLHRVMSLDRSRSCTMETANIKRQLPYLGSIYRRHYCWKYSPLRLEQCQSYTLKTTKLFAFSLLSPASYWCDDYIMMMAGNSLPSAYF